VCSPCGSRWTSKEGMRCIGPELSLKLVLLTFSSSVSVTGFQTFNCNLSWSNHDVSVQGTVSLPVSYWTHRARVPFLAVLPVSRPSQLQAAASPPSASWSALCGGGSHRRLLNRTACSACSPEHRRRGSGEDQIDRMGDPRQPACKRTEKRGSEASSGVPFPTGILRASSSMLGR
jgi:hypothetical protein